MRGVFTSLPAKHTKIGIACIDAHRRRPNTNADLYRIRCELVKSTEPGKQIFQGITIDQKQDGKGWHVYCIYMIW